MTFFGCALIMAQVPPKINRRRTTTGAAAPNLSSDRLVAWSWPKAGRVVAQDVFHVEHLTKLPPCGPVCPEPVTLESFVVANVAVAPFVVVSGRAGLATARASVNVTVGRQVEKVFLANVA